MISFKKRKTKQIKITKNKKTVKIIVAVYLFQCFCKFVYSVIKISPLYHSCPLHAFDGCRTFMQHGRPQNENQITVGLFILSLLSCAQENGDLIVPRCLLLSHTFVKRHIAELPYRSVCNSFPLTQQSALQFIQNEPHSHKGM